MLDELSTRIIRNKAFQREYVELLSAALRQTVAFTAAASRPGLSEDAIARLLECAMHFAGARDVQARALAYEIAISCWHLQSTSRRHVSNVLHVVMSRLGNFPAVQFLQSKSSEFATDALLPLPIWLESEAHALKNTVALARGYSVRFTDFQCSVWEALRRGHAVAVSAPTSAGKSYALLRYVCERAAAEDAAVTIYIVPTRALINQVFGDIAGQLSGAGVRDVSLSTIPLSPATLESPKAVYVLTQERAQVLLTAVPDLCPLLVVVDEAQQVSEGARGILLQNVLTTIRSRSNSTQFLFSTPGAKNLKSFEETLELQQVEVVTTREPAVSQRLVVVERAPLDSSVDVHVRVGDHVVNLGLLDVGRGLYDERQTLAYLAWYFGRDSVNLVYSSGPAECEKLALLIVDAIKSETDEMEERADRQEFASFLREYVHPEYLLADAVLVGVGFHYGAMPGIVRSGVEELVKAGAIKFLVCTSTLLQGVNIPARNMFMLKPTKGEDRPIGSADFWTLAGRAGRLGKEFDGNVYLLDKSRWQSDPTLEHAEEPVRLALASILGDLGPQVLAMARGEPMPKMEDGVRQSVESAFVKLFNDCRRGRLERTLALVGIDIASSFGRELRAAMETADERISVPKRIAESHTSISVFKQQRMLEYIAEKVEAEGTASVVPVHPLRPGAYEAMARLLSRIHRVFEEKPPKDRSHSYYALRALAWMRGDSLREMIESTLKYKTEHQKRRPRVATVIREVMREVDKRLCFEYVKYTRCYIDLLAHVLIEAGHEEATRTIPAIPLYLELGACSDTMISLVGLGFSRTTAAVLASRTTDQNMDRRATVRWLTRQSISTLDLPAICEREVERLFHALRSGSEGV